MVKCTIMHTDGLIPVGIRGKPAKNSQNDVIIIIIIIMIILTMVRVKSGGIVNDGFLRTRARTVAGRGVIAPDAVVVVVLLLAVFGQNGLSRRHERAHLDRGIVGDKRRQRGFTRRRRPQRN